MAFVIEVTPETQIGPAEARPKDWQSVIVYQLFALYKNNGPLTPSEVKC